MSDTKYFKESILSVLQSIATHLYCTSTRLLILTSEHQLDCWNTSNYSSSWTAGILVYEVFQTTGTSEVSLVVQSTAMCFFSSINISKRALLLG